MNNKLFKRIVAAAASAVMLGTCAFATTLSNEAYENGILSFSYDNGAANKVTYLAYSATKIAADDTTSTVGYTDANGTKYVLGEIVAIDQIDGITANAGGTVSAKIDTSKLENKDAIILKSGDSNGTAVATSVVSLATTPAYTVTISKANAYKGTARIVRVYGLDKTKTVTIDGVDARYYTNNESKIVHIAAVAQSEADPVIGFKDSEPKQIFFGDVNGNGNSKPNLADATLFKRTQAGYTPAGGSKFVYPTEPMECLVWDINGDGNLNLADATLMKRTQAGYTPAGGTKYTYDNLTVYSVK